MPRFKTDYERMKHKQAKLIPASVWHDNQLFYEVLDDTVLSLMKAKPAELMLKLEKSLPRLNNQWLKKQAWLGIALTQPLDLIMLQKVADKLQFNSNTVFALLAILGNKALLNEFTAQYDRKTIQEMIKDDDFYAYTKAAENGHLDVLKYFEEKAPKFALEMVKSRNYYSYKYAAPNGHLEVLKHLEEQASGMEMIKAQQFYAYKLAASRGKLEVLQYLETKAPSLVNDMIKADNFYAFRKSVENNHSEISNWILRKSASCLAFAEMHMHEYGNVVNPFIEHQLAILHRKAIDIPPHSVFDIAHSEETKICFYMIRNLIRRNDRALDDEIRFLLNIPSVKASAHREVTSDQSNELIQLALTTGNQEAASILLNIPEVRLLTEQNGFYRAEINGRLDLGKLARDQESAMTALSKGEQKRLDAAIQRYQPILESRGVAHLIDALREQLRTRYEKNPATITKDDGAKIALPMDFADFKKMGLNQNEYKRAAKAYYQHKDHTAWRYLQKPNPWMNPEAAYVYHNIRTGERWATFAEYQPLIALFWVAACDESIPPTDGHTLESRLDHFIDELALIGRTHNWDNTRINQQGKNEEYDDLTGDRPSCFSGVKRRLFQSVLGHPLISILTEDMILEEIRHFARTYFQSKITKENKAALKEAFDDYIVNTTEVNEESKELLMLLNITDTKQDVFEDYLSNKYGAQYTEDYYFHKLLRDKLSVTSSSDFFSECHALKLDGITGLYQILNEPEEHSTKSIQSSQFRLFSSLPSGKSHNKLEQLEGKIDGLGK